MNERDRIHLGVGRLLAAYADVVTRGSWAELEDLFIPQAHIHIAPAGRPAVDVVGPAALGEFIRTATDRFAFFEMVILNHVVTESLEAGAAGRAYVAEHRQDRDDGGWSTAYGRYDDRYVERDGDWLFAERRYATLARMLPTTGRP